MDIDTTGKYEVAFVTLTVITIVSALLLVAARPQKPPPEIGDIEKFV